MPVPRRRKKQGMARIMDIPNIALRLFDVDFVFQNTRGILLYVFAPTVIYLGMTKEPRPASWFDLINILE
eukprot:CAMPEP_0194026954 /NCGR_PEP_ID=MMETSP0009_2-20130614/1194_1 /TAXON_ID=210454 /ORGANISM="Grammatophora oceanica, Strain CCMP 410" /LENGTH=69 /DNA_ID=CAMNT_0038665855 /DNA_START=79 /DNA_END=288 /DNA_ORIENTATION=+